MLSIPKLLALIFGGRPVAAAWILRKKRDEAERLLDEIENEKSNHRSTEYKINLGGKSSRPNKEEQCH